MALQTRVLIIGGGITGTAIARDLALRGVPGVLVEASHLNAGASGANHGVLHSGARYITSDPESSRECVAENALLKKVAPHCIENTGGLYVAVKEDDEHYLADFHHLCQKCGVPCQPVDTREACEMEPILAKDIIAAYRTEDSSIDPFRVSLENMAQAVQLGYRYLPYTRAVGFDIGGKQIQRVTVENVLSGTQQIIEAEQVINAAGAWVGEIAALAGAAIEILYSKGSLLVTHARLARHLLLRLRPPSDGDVLCPGGTVSILGPSSVRLDSPHNTRPTVAEVQHIIDQGLPIIPALKDTRFIRAYAGVRPLIAKKRAQGSGKDASDDRMISRGFDLIDHAAEGVDNFLTVAGGKLSIFRLMAEKAANQICERLRVDAPCRTRVEPLPATQGLKWTEPGASPKIWFESLALHNNGALENREPEPPEAGDTLLCECEMVSQKALESIMADVGGEKGKNLLHNIGARSRIGKGACQGTWCGLRLTAALYDQGQFQDDQGIADLKHFIGSRWKGQQPVLFGEQLKQAQLAESIYCGMFDLELPAGQ